MSMSIIIILGIQTTHKGHLGGITPGVYNLLCKFNKVWQIGLDSTKMMLGNIVNNRILHSIPSLGCTLFPMIFQIVVVCIFRSSGLYLVCFLAAMSSSSSDNVTQSVRSSVCSSGSFFWCICSLAPQIKYANVYGVYHEFQTKKASH